MTNAAAHDAIERLRCPLPEGLARELLAFWSRLFAEPFDRFAPVLAGAEAAFNDDDIYLVRQGHAVVATCRLTVCKADSRRGLLGEVATDASCRGRGLAERLCAQARDDFAQRSHAFDAFPAASPGLGRALFLATSNPAARRLYQRLGWRGLPNANVMVWQSLGDGPKAIDPPTRPGDPFTLVPGSPALRAPMVSCITRDHPWLSLDANTRILSTRHLLQPSCEGLYSRYEELAGTRRGAWLAAMASPGQVLGLASVLPLVGGGASHRVDAFADHRRPDVWAALLVRALSLARGMGASACEALVATRDGEKRAWLISRGFTDAGPGEPIVAGGTAGEVAFETGRMLASTERLELP